MSTNCSWCGAKITGEAVMSGEIYHYTFGGSGESEPIINEIGFCCDGCAWAWEIEEHRIMGLMGKAAREHLINEHGLKHPPGSPAGKQSKECFDDFAGEVEKILSIIYPDLIGA